MTQTVEKYIIINNNNNKNKFIENLFKGLKVNKVENF